jgi:hypothetical protein
MTTLRQIEANRRNARHSTGPITAEGKLRSRRNAIRHVLTAETVIVALENAEDYKAFEAAITTDYDANQPWSVNWCCGWRACCGGFAARRGKLRHNCVSPSRYAALFTPATNLAFQRVHASWASRCQAARRS